MNEIKGLTYTEIFNKAESILYELFGDDSIRGSVKILNRSNSTNVFLTISNSVSLEPIKDIPGLMFYKNNKTVTIKI